jgi:DNA phosphorothioation system restriction enzyme
MSKKLKSDRLDELRFEITYRSDSNQILEDFYIPCMKCSQLYRRAVGYFTSSGLALAAPGVAHLIKNDGKIQLIASPQLSDEDVSAIREGYESRDEVLKRIAQMTFQEISDALIKDRLAALAWLISSGAMDVKLALKKDTKGRITRGLYHEKLGIFSDRNNNAVAFAGSSNETLGGLLENFEAIDVYWSWDDMQGRVRRKIQDFESLWNNMTEGLEIIEFTKVADEILNVFKTKSPPVADPLEKYIHIKQRELDQKMDPSIPADVELRDYQSKAVENWFNNNGRGTLKMATGSGKTIVALAIAVKLYEKINLEAVIIICPFRHLVTQWQRACESFGIKSILAFESKTKWVDELTNKLYGAGLGKKSFFAVITTNATYASEVFQARLRYFPAKTLIVADEVHNLGAKKLRNVLPENIKLRLGLSATPERWFDEEGTAALADYFGKTLEPQFTLKEAIQKKALVPYYYYPILVELTEEEIDKYLVITNRIGMLLSRQEIDEDDPGLAALLSQRSRLLAVAQNKLPALRELMEARLNKSHMLFYCGDGTVEDETGDEIIRHVDAVCRLLGNELGYQVSSYTAETPLDEREDLRERLDSGELKGLVAIRCLDEGIDIPSIRAAVIMSSTSNPRQFIQRRGRILRPYPDKKAAEIYDMIVIPPTESQICEPERNIVRRELLRCIEFADLALNAGEARGKLLDIQKKFDLVDI